MPFHAQRMRRRRQLLGISQANLGITAGVSLTTIVRLELDQAPEGGGKTGIDVAMRLADALQMDVQDLLIAPVGNRYQAAVEFAARQHSPAANARTINDRSRSVLAQGYQRLAYPQRAEEPTPEPEREPEPVASVSCQDDTEATEPETMLEALAERREWDWQKDPSTE